MWNPFNKSYKIDYGFHRVHVHKCKMSKAFKDIYPKGMSLWNIVVTYRITELLALKIMQVEGVAQAVPNIGGYNIIIQIPSTYPSKVVIAMCMLAINNYYMDLIYSKQEENIVPSDKGEPPKKETIQ